MAGETVGSWRRVGFWHGPVVGLGPGLEDALANVDGGQDYDLVAYTDGQLADGILDQYERAPREYVRMQHFSG